MIDVIFSFDTTGSMYPCLSEVRREVEKTAHALFSDIPDLRIGLIAHGDYCDRFHKYITKHQPLTASGEEVAAFVRGVGRTSGGDIPECYELVLHEARGFEWRDGAQRVLVVIGDAMPHAQGAMTNGVRVEHDWRLEASALRDSGVTIHSVQCLGRRRANFFYEQLAEIGCGKRLTLSQFHNITELVMAVCYQQAGSLQQYADTLVMNRGLALLLRQLDDGIKIDGVHVEARGDGLVPVPPHRFQVLHVDRRVSIRKFVEETGADFAPGRGFYELTKSSLIQERKEVVLVDRVTGDMFSGGQAREMIGLPFGLRGKVYPREVRTPGFDVFVQSTSYNRVLLPGTRFLYDVER